MSRYTNRVKHINNKIESMIAYGQAFDPTLEMRNFQALTKEKFNGGAHPTILRDTFLALFEGRLHYSSYLKTWVLVVISDGKFSTVHKSEEEIQDFLSFLNDILFPYRNTSKQLKIDYSRIKSI